MLEQDKLQKIMNGRYLRLRALNPSYSLRAFAKKLAMSPGAVSELLKGQRRASLKVAEKIAEKLLLDPQERAYLFEQFPSRLKRIPRHTGKNHVLKYRQLTSDQFEVVAEWQHFAILSLIETDNFKASPRFIADRLGISQVSSEQAFKRLVRLGLITKTEDDKYKLTSNGFRTSDDIASVSLSRAHHQNLEKAKNSLERDEVKTRDFTFITMAVNLELIPQAKEKIRKFQDEMSALLETGNRTEVYQMCVQLYPLSKVSK